jgi:hypothetical protein
MFLLKIKSKNRCAKESRRELSSVNHKWLNILLIDEKRTLVVLNATLSLKID